MNTEKGKQTAEQGRGGGRRVGKKGVGQASVPAEGEEGGVTFYKRRLPHWRSANATYFVTWRLLNSQPDLAPDERTVVRSTVQHFNKRRYEILAYVVMNDHVHVLACPLGTYRLEDILHSWKSYSVYRLQREYGRQGRVWQDESFDRVIRDERELLEKAQYILNNPKKRWPDIEEYLWVGGELIEP